MKQNESISTNYIPSINGNPRISDKQDNVNFIPESGSQNIVDGQYLYNNTVRISSFTEFPAVDKKYVAGEDIDAGEACGLWGYITDISSYSTAAQATYVQENNGDTNYDGSNPILTSSASTPLQVHGLLSWSDLPAIPSETGITVLKIYVQFKYNITGGTSTDGRFHINTATFNETTVTWNTGRPANGGEGLAYLFTAGTGEKEGSYIELTSTQYNNLRTNGLTSFCIAPSVMYFSDEDQANPPKVRVKFIYEVQDGKAYLSSGLATKYADGFRGIAQNNALKGQDIVLRLEGIDSNQTGLTPYADYELSDTPGAIQTGSAATSDKVIGNARSATDLQVKYILNDAT